MIDLANLEPLISQEVTASLKRDLPKPQPDRLIAGFLGTMRFIVSLDSDGQCEVSLSCENRPPKPAQVAAFFRRWGRPVPLVPPFPILRGRGVMWVLQRGKRQ